AMAAERGEAELGAIHLPELRSLFFEASMTREHARDLANARLPRLRRLALSFDPYGPHGAWKLLPTIWTVIVMRVVGFFSQDKESLLAAFPSVGSVLKQFWLRLRGRLRRVERHACQLEDLEAIFDADGMPELFWLKLEGAPFADQLPAALARSKLLGRLVLLDLKECNMSDAGARALLEHASAFAHLRSLRLS